MSTTDELVDRIDRQIDIDAPAERVYALVSRPGWWINEDEVDPAPELRREGDLSLLVHPAYGEFRIRTLVEEPPRHVAFAWLEGPSGESGTTVEFWIEDRPGGVTLRVAESGFAALRKEREAIVRHVEENTHGWEAELAAAQRFVMGQGAARGSAT